TTSAPFSTGQPRGPSLASAAGAASARHNKVISVASGRIGGPIVAPGHRRLACPIPGNRTSATAMAKDRTKPMLSIPFIGQVWDPNPSQQFSQQTDQTTASIPHDRGSSRQERPLALYGPNRTSGTQPHHPARKFEKGLLLIGTPAVLFI